LATTEKNRSFEVSNHKMDAFNASTPVNGSNKSAENGLNLNRSAPVKRSAPLTKCKLVKKSSKLAKTSGLRTENISSDGLAKDAKSQEEENQPGTSSQEICTQPTLLRTDQEI